MSASPETAAMTTPAQPHHPTGTATEPPAPDPDTASPAAGSAHTSGSAAGTDMPGAADAPAAQRRELSAGAAIALFGGLMTTMVGVLAGLMMWQFDSLDDRINTLGTELRSEIDTLETSLRNEIGDLETGLRGEMATLETSLRGEIGDLRSEMQAGFREVNATLLDHTDRLARLEASDDTGT